MSPLACSKRTIRSMPWRERMMDLFDGMGRAAKPREIRRRRLRPADGAARFVDAVERRRQFTRGRRLGGGAYLEITYGCGAYRPYEALVREAARDVGLAGTLGEQLEWRWQELAPWPEASAVLSRLGVPLAVATNCSIRLGQQAASRVSSVCRSGNGRKRWLLQASARTLSHRAGGTRDRPERTLFVAGSASDVPVPGRRHGGLLAQSHRVVATDDTRNGLPRTDARPAECNRDLMEPPLHQVTIPLRGWLLRWARSLRPGTGLYQPTRENAWPT